MKRLFASLMVVCLSACGGSSPAAPQAVAQTTPAAGLPDQMAVKIGGPDGKPSLQGWKTTPAPAGTPGLRYYLVHIEPEDAAFAGAKAFGGSWDAADAVSAARNAAAAEGFETTRVLAQAAVDPVVARLEPGGRVTSVLLAGKLDGQPALFAGYVWYGALGELDGKVASGVQGFVAPEPVFVALGGYAVPAILSGIAVATPDTPMSVDGAKPADVQAKELADLFAGWAASRQSGDNLSTMNMIMQGNLGVQSGTGCINVMGCVGGGTAPVYTPPRY